MAEYTFDKLTDNGTFTVGIDTAANYGYFERNSNGSGGGLWFDSNKELTDYDGVFELPAQVIAIIELLGFNADYAKDNDNE